MIEIIGLQAALGFTGLFLSFVFLCVGAIRSFEPEEPPRPQKPGKDGRVRAMPVIVRIK